MKRDMDIIRKILLKIEGYECDEPLQALEIEGYLEDEIRYNVYLLENAELIQGKCFFNIASVKPSGYAIFRMTWTGHDFLEACRDEGRWTKAKEIFGKLDGVTFDVVKQVLVELTMTAAKQMIPGGAP